MPVMITDAARNRITSYNVCYTKLLRAGRAHPPHSDRHRARRRDRRRRPGRAALPNGSLRTLEGTAHVPWLGDVDEMLTAASA